MESRVPVVAILGHVDHGKTTILDKIRGTDVQNREVGGMTQKISAFTIEKNGKKITFIDTPGHEAFDLMRLRGGSIADIVLLIIAADDGIKPQTEESIEIIKNSTAKPIVVLNKVDLPDLDIEKIKRDVTNKGISVEGMGGKVPVVEVSGKTGKGLDDLLETISLLAEVEGVQDRGTMVEGVKGKAVVLETIKDKGMGIVSTIITLNGKVEIGDWLGFEVEKGIHFEKVKGIVTEEGDQMERLEEGFGGRILGVSSKIEPGSYVYCLDEHDEKLLASLYKKEKEEEQIAEEEVGIDVNALFGGAQEDGEKHLNVIVKSSSEGSLEAIKKSLNKVEDDGFKVKVIDSGIGEISLNDIETATVSKAIVLGFEVSTAKGVDQLAQERKILVRTYDVIYKLIEEVSDAVSSMASPKETEEEIGQAEVRAIFELTNGSKVIGCRVKEGVVKKGCKVYVVRGDDIIDEGKIESLRNQKDTINEAKSGQEFGAILNVDTSAQVGDALYCYKIIK